jgi:hypothetical protein
MSFYNRFSKPNLRETTSRFDALGRLRKQEDPNQNLSSRQTELNEAKARAQEKVQGLIRVTRFKSYLQSGMTADQAAQIMGIKVDPMDRYNAAKIMQKVEEGKEKI